MRAEADAEILRTRGERGPRRQRTLRGLCGVRLKSDRVRSGVTGVVFRVRRGSSDEWCVRDCEVVLGRCLALGCSCCFATRHWHDARMHDSLFIRSYTVVNYKLRIVFFSYTKLISSK